MSKLSDISNAAVREMLGTYSVGTIVLAATGSAATLKSTQSPAASFFTVINGVPRLKANLSGYALATLAALQFPETGQNGYYIQPAGTAVYYLLVINAAGTVYAIQGSYAGQSFVPFTSKLGTGDLPGVAVKETYAPIGCMLMTTDASHTFTPATTNTDATGCTATFADLNVLPSVNPTTA